MKKNFKVIFTSAGDPVPWKEKIKGAGFSWFHIVPSVKGALRCKKAGVDIIVALLVLLKHGLVLLELRQH